MKAALIIACCALILPVVVNADPEVLLEPDTAIVGFIPQSSNFHFSSTVYSVGTDTLIIMGIETFCDCLTMTTDKYVLPPGDSARISVIFKSQKVEGHNIRYPRINTNAKNLGGRPLRLTIVPIVIKDPEVLSPIYVKPYRLIASQYGDSGPKEFRFAIHNKSEEYVPLRLIYCDTTFFSLEMPDFVPPLDSAIGYIRLNEAGYSGDFETNVTFEFINNDSEPAHYTIPIHRKIYRNNNK